MASDIDWMVRENAKKNSPIDIHRTLMDMSTIRRWLIWHVMFEARFNAVIKDNLDHLIHENQAVEKWRRRYFFENDAVILAVKIWVACAGVDVY